jgi:hypothetical protein
MVAIKAVPGDASAAARALAVMTEESRLANFSAQRRSARLPAPPL